MIKNAFILFLSIFSSIALQAQETSGYNLQNFYQYDAQLEHKVDRIFHQLSDSARIGQMIVPAVGRLGKPTEHVNMLIKHNMVGGVLLLNGTKQGFTALTKNMDNLAMNFGSLPLLFSADAEPSLIGRKIKGTTPVPKTIDIRDSLNCVNVTKKINHDLIDIGIRQNYAPVSDVSPNNSAIGNRSFGSNMDSVIFFNKLFINTTQQAQIVATAKHFPGHGYVVGDTHKKLVYIKDEMKELDVYRALITDGVLSIMVAHIAVDTEEYNTHDKAASTSSRIIKDLLQGELGFRGLVVTDALNMGALNGQNDAAFEAAKAGSDMLLMPIDEIKTFNAILKEIKNDDNFRQQVYQSAKKIIRMKICLGLID